MSKEHTLALAKSLLDGIGEDLQDDGTLKMVTVTVDHLGNQISGVRTVAGYPALAPHPESQSLLYGKPVYFDLLVNGPKIIADLVDLVENGAKSARNEANSD